MSVWKIAPLFKGVGVASAIMAFWLNTFYIVVLSWALYYLWNSFSFVLPWSTCGNWWNTENCVPLSVDNMTIYTNKSVSSAVEFWEFEHFLVIVYFYF